MEDNFKPEYEVMKGKSGVIRDLKKYSSKSDEIFLASDPDREGEAIAWHIKEQIKGKTKNVHRVMFYEITKKGIQEGLKNPKEIDIKKVHAQQSRRILDRLVGYEVSPLLWKPLRYGLSAGRVQSVALGLVVKRDDEIAKFKPREYWDVIVNLNIPKKGDLEAKVERKNNKKLTINNKEEVDAILSDLKKGGVFRWQN